ncbi:PRC-barrel domain-containing protein [Roseitranquillus sediminis]|uniref:PRC-barrel domain-containing protein n=1 Tax=Roseitranquillus sediminis TaxID=2809051 RepID=UPI001D0C3F7E|nr:PRC-barrel domain-containing protein [Roseitranquillus sediminis]MBM9593497.1 hypothetical protein [Roseitranquillus sediminis]
MITIKNLLGRKAVAKSNGDAMRVTEIFFHERTGHLRYVALATGSVFKRKEILVAIGRFSPPADDEATWEVAVDADEIESAPVWRHEPERPPLALEAWPPIITGPFGYTTSPLLMYAAYADAGGEAEEPTPPEPADPRMNRLERATRRIGGEVFGEDGLLGRLDDLAIDPQTLTINAFLVNGRRVPWSALHHMPEEGEYTVLDLDRARLGALPEV